LLDLRVQEGRAAAPVTPSKGSDMSAKDVEAEIPAAQNFHPEFGYLCPSAQMRRKVRSAALTVLAGMVIAAGTALALVSQLVQPPGDGAPEPSPLSVAAASPAAAALPLIDQTADEGKLDDGRADGGRVGKDKPAAMAHASAVTDRPASGRASISCDDLSGAFLAPQCKFGKAGKSRMTRSARAAHAASRQVAIIPIGRSEAPLQVEPQGAEPQKAALSRPAPAAESAPGAVATNADPAMPAAEKPAASAKRPVKTAHKQAPGRDVASADTRVSTPSPGFGLFGAFHEPPHSGNGGAGSRAWAMSW